MDKNELMKQQIVILGDSLGMPRLEEDLKYSDTYPCLLKEANFDVINRARRANDTFKQSEPLNLSDDISDFEGDIYIVHLGIVDCAPRIFSKKESKILSLLPGSIRKLITNTASKYRNQITKYRNITYVNSKDFEKNLKKIINHIAKNKKIILIKILDTDDNIKERSFNIASNINTYNEIIEQVALEYECDLIDPNLLFCTNKLLEDGIHINLDMHTCLTSEIIMKLNEK